MRIHELKILINGMRKDRIKQIKVELKEKRK